MTRELVWTGFVSVDGVMDSPGGPSEGHAGGGWVFRTDFDEASFSLKGEELADTSALLFGRRSYEAFAPIWSRSEDHAAYQDLPKYVVSSSLDEASLVDGWGETTILRSVGDVAALKETEGGGIFVHGSGELTRGLAAAGLVDRYNLLVFPVLLGDGKSVFGREHQGEQRLALRESAAYGNGVLKAVYDVVR
ncbi:deaminase reductase [Paraoerskovia sediminicola]|uniref:Deaminase reductase n=1 Tax=Paraoerskovia sediminicola TaxID=1138587 RepID=A0ABN6XBV0_9CELL|nr:dihydrofolate reductase family protein [Paraoerskovia sediminicola]BDZ42200.1 deaminase reductase [Paraoerskovia sediminicola]